MKEWAQVCARTVISGLRLIDASRPQSTTMAISTTFYRRSDILGWVVDANVLPRADSATCHASLQRASSSARLERSNLGKSYVQRSDAVKKMRQHEDTTEAEGQPRA